MEIVIARMLKYHWEDPVYITKGKEAYIFRINHRQALRVTILSEDMSEDMVSSLPVIANAYLQLMDDNNERHQQIPEILLKEYTRGAIQSNRKKQIIVDFNDDFDVTQFKHEIVLLYTILEWVDGITLHDLSIANELTPTHCYLLLDTLISFWKHGFVHGDLTARNIMWSNHHRQWKLIDTAARSLARPIIIETLSLKDIRVSLIVADHPDLNLFTVIIPLLQIVLNL
jgi:hypothetical protein